VDIGALEVINAKDVCLFVPAGLKKFKLDLFTNIAVDIRRAGGQVALHDMEILKGLPDDVIPIVGCTVELRPIIDDWIARKRKWIYWDRGYWSRVFATWLPRGENGGMYRWHVGSYQLQQISEFPPDRLKRHQPPVRPWRKGGRHIVIAQPTIPYSDFHQLDRWIDYTLKALSGVTNRQIVIRCKDSKRSLQDDLEGAHALVTHGSNAAVEACILGCPVFVDRASAAALVGSTDLSKIEEPVYPDREPWLRALSYSQFDEKELVDGTLWRLLG
jgi:hypothetical protein